MAGRFLGDLGEGKLVDVNANCFEHAVPLFHARVILQCHTSLFMVFHYEFCFETLHTFMKL